jgi:hypothetical protein
LCASPEMLELADHTLGCSDCRDSFFTYHEMTSCMSKSKESESRDEVIEIPASDRDGDCRYGFGRGHSFI